MKVELTRTENIEEKYKVILEEKDLFDFCLYKDPEIKKLLDNSSLVPSLAILFYEDGNNPKYLSLVFTDKHNHQSGLTLPKNGCIELGELIDYIIDNHLVFMDHPEESEVSVNIDNSDSSNPKYITEDNPLYLEFTINESITRKFNPEWVSND